jgi:hypothetical protein
VKPAALLILTAAVASASALDPALERDGWFLETVAGAAPARFARAEDGAIAVAADNAVGFLVRRLPPQTAAPLLSWRWRVDRMPPPSDLRQAGGDDRPLAVHVVFPPLDDGGLVEAIVRGVRRAVGGALLSGRVITYVWGGTEARGARFRSPYLPQDAGIVVLRGVEAPLGEWFDESVDVAADFRAAFGAAAPAPRFLVVSSDTDDRGGGARGMVDRLGFASGNATP